MATQQNANSALPSPWQVFRSDPDLDRIERVAAVERKLVEAYGVWHSPVWTTSGECVLQYFAMAVDAKWHRNRAARRIIEVEIIEERRRETLFALGLPHGQVLPAVRSLADEELAKSEREVA